MSPIPDATPHAVAGRPIVPGQGANQFHACIVEFTVVVTDIEAGVAFYRDVLGHEVLEAGELSAPRIFRDPQRRRYTRLSVPGRRAGAVRLLEAPPNAVPNRPRPTSRLYDPGLAVMECLTVDPAESYHRLVSAGTPIISPPRYYFFRSIQMGRDDSAQGHDLDVMSYAAFGPGGEQLFITASVRGDRPPWSLPGLHAGFTSVVITCLDQAPVEDFYSRALGLQLASEMDCFQANVAELTGVEPGTYFRWGFLGKDVSIEVEEYRVASAIAYPTSLERTGLAMITLAVDDVAELRRRGAENGIEPLVEQALATSGRDEDDGFLLRGAAGELIEAVPA